MNIGKWQWVRTLWGAIYKRWRYDAFYDAYWDVDQVLGWRTARLSYKGHKICVTPVFWWLQ